MALQNSFFRGCPGTHSRCILSQEFGKLLGGLNPVAAAVESGIAVENVAESGMLDFGKLVSFWSLKA